jgi:hypothetical protein
MLFRCVPLKMTDQPSGRIKLTPFEKHCPCDIARAIIWWSLQVGEVVTITALRQSPTADAAEQMLAQTDAGASFTVVVKSATILPSGVANVTFSN